MYVNCATIFFDYEIKPYMHPVNMTLECLTDTCCHVLLHNNIIYALYSFRHGTLFGILHATQKQLFGDCVIFISNTENGFRESSVIALFQNHVTFLSAAD